MKNFKLFSCVIISFVCLVGTNTSVLAQQPKQDTIHVIGHSHQDMNWLWTYFETMKMCNDNLRQTVAFMKEFPDFTLLQSQASVYTFVEKVDPPLFEEVKKYVKEGRLEIAGGMWTEGDMNMSSGEAIARTFLLGQRYFQNHFEKMAHIGWLPDNFGHISQMPQILDLAGCDYFYFHRCKPFKGSFWWVGTDNTKILCYANDGYNGSIYPELKNDFQTYGSGKRHILQITGVGDHGGGPTRENIDMVHKLDKEPDFPAIKFTTADNFFKAIERNASDLPVHHGEMQYIFEGCYTTVAEIKEGNRKNEAMLYSAEFLNTLRWLGGNKYPANELRDLWTTVSFNQFHDILPGSAIYEANREAVARYTETLREATELRDGAFFRLADEVKFKADMGQPVVAYNMQPVSRKVVVEANVYSHENPVTISATYWGDYYGGKNIMPNEGKVATVLVRDGEGKSYPAQIVYAKQTPPGVTSKVQFIVDEFPAGGYKTFYIDTTKPGEDNGVVSFNDNTFDTDLFTVKVNMNTGGITSLIDKRNNFEYVRKGEELNKLRIYMESKKGQMKSWTINKFVNQYDVTDVKSVKLVENGPVRACIQTEKAWGKSKFIERMYIYRDYPRIEYDMEVHWFETGNQNEDSPFLRAIFPLAEMKNARFYNQVPFDIIERPADDMLGGKPTPEALKNHLDGWFNEAGERSNGQEVPAQKWVTVTDGEKGLALLNKTKYGHSYEKGDLRISLMRSAGEPDIYPNIGKFNISYALYPHQGDWKSDLWAEGENYNIPIYAAEPPSLSFGKGHASRPEEASLLTVAPANVAMTGMKQAEEGGELIIRLVEIEGKETTATINLPVNAKQARRLNILEMPLKGTSAAKVSGNTVTVTLKPNEIVTLGIKK